MKTAAWVLIVASLAGCADSARQLNFPSTLDQLRPFGDYTWPAPAFSDSRGALLALPSEAAPGRYVQMLLPGQGSDPTLALEPSGGILISAFEDVQRTNDYGRNWTVVHSFTGPLTEVQHDRLRSRGAYLHYDGVSGRVWVSHLSIGIGVVPPVTTCATLAWTDDGGRSWTNSTTASYPTTCVSPYNNGKLTKLLAAPHGPQASRALDVLGRERVLYVCGAYPWVGPRCDISFDGGDTFPRQSFLQTPTDPSCDVMTLGAMAASAEGAVVIPFGQTQAPLETVTGLTCTRGERPGLAVTVDDGLTWTTRTAPEPISIHDPTPDVAFSPDGVAYLAFSSGNTILMYRSSDLFQTWQGPFRVTHEAVTLATRPTIVAGAEGRVAISYLGTRTPQDLDPIPELAKGNTRWHLFVARSEEADSENPRFLTVQATPDEDPVQVGCVGFPRWGVSAYFQAWTEAPSYFCENLLYFLDSLMDPDGRLLVAFADGCDPRNQCTADTASGFQARERRTSLLVQESGPSLKDGAPLVPLGLEPPRPFAKEDFV